MSTQTATHSHGVRSVLLAVTVIAGLLSAADGRAADPSGEAVYRESCAACHESGENRAPSLEVLRHLSAEAVLTTLREGTMAYVGETLPPGAAAAVAAYLGRGTGTLTARSTPTCPDAEWSDPHSAPHWTGWAQDLSNTRFQRSGFARLDAAAVPRLQLRRAFGLADSERARGAPAVAGGRVFVGARNGSVFALEAKSGCTVWEFKAQAEVRTAVLLSPSGPEGRWTAYFGDTRANLYALDAISGTQIWWTRLDEHRAATLTGSPVEFEGRLYVGLSSIEKFTGASSRYPCCAFRGSLAAIDASNGERIWNTRTIPEEPTPRKRNRKGVMQHGPSGAGIWSAPTVDTKLRRVYVTTGDNYSDPPTPDSDASIAYDLGSGERLWSRQFTEGDSYNMSCNAGADKVNCPEANGPDYDFGASAMLVELEGGNRLLVAGQKSGMVHAVDPDEHGAIVWQRRVGKGGKLGGIQFGPAGDSENAYVAVSDYRGPRPDSVGGITAIRLSDGSVVWDRPEFRCPAGRKGCSPAQSAAVTAIPGAVFSGSLDGFLRAYSTVDGEVLWSHDTIREYWGTVNGVWAKGGSTDGPGPVVVDGMVYVNSGYGQFGSIPGNVLLALGIDDE
ncbi:MAG: PQQ-binding-like beta-propeller repeat protein [Bryobacterales bacterium]|nr:PQQ-binding-like beta-propeller repeat protein [Bryobacterales bacterium]